MTKSSELTFDKLTTIFNPEVERFFKDNNMMVSSTDAWGVLRRDLIVALGVERAKRFLLRYGWNCGKNEARILRSVFDWSDDVEWLLAGSKMHNIGGRVFSYPIKFNVSIAEGKFDVSGYWVDSYEAKQHLHHFSYYHEPVCHFLVGYAGGYTSECLGKKIIFKETHCVGKGDKECRYTGKTIEQWGDEITEDLYDYEDHDISDELDRVYRRVEKQKETLKIGSSISKKLTHALLQGKGLDDFAILLSKEIHYPVVIHNQYFDCIASFIDESEYGHILNYFNELQVEEKLERTTQLELKNNHNILISPIVIRREIFGYISIIKEGVKFEEPESDFLERAATICALQVLNEKTAIETEDRMKGELLEELFNNNEADVTLISQKLSYLGYNLREPHYVLVFQLDEEPNIGTSINSDNDAFQLAKVKLLNYIQRETELYHCKVLTSVRMNKIHALIPCALIKKRNTDIKAFAKHCYGILVDEETTKSPAFYIGISTKSEGINSFNKKFLEANKAIEIAKVRAVTTSTEKKEAIISANDLGHLLMLLDARNPDELKHYADQKLGSIATYDEKNDTELLKTLYFYMDNECNLHKTSRVMNVSISGMRYRIQRFQELADIDLSQSSYRFEVQIALQIYLVFGFLKLT